MKYVKSTNADSTENKTFAGDLKNVGFIWSLSRIYSNSVLLRTKIS